MSEEESVGDIENDLEIVLDEEQPEQSDYTEDRAELTTNENEENDESKKAVKPKRVVKNPQPKLNEQTLKGARGLVAIESYFERVKFKGRGYEEQDLNVLLKTYEYWCHRLFPKFPFDNSIERLEKLGTKRATQTHIKRIRMDLNFDQPENTILRDEEEVADTGGFVDTYNDQFDQLTSTTEQEHPEITEEQLERIRQNMENAKRLREEKLRKINEVTQNTLEIHNQIDTQVTGYCQFDSAVSTAESTSQSQNIGWEDTSDNTEHTQMDIQQIESNKFQNGNTENDKKHSGIYEVEEFEQSKSVNTNRGEDNEDDIDNILDFINTNNTFETNKPSDNNQNQVDTGNSSSLNQKEYTKSGQIEDIISNEEHMQENM